jgi:predicted AlkP superfamily phosphohydrolase/phosphomutase
LARLLVIGLDGYELTLADAMMRMGQLPSLARAREDSARFLLDHGSARGTGLAWEHVSSGLSPKDGGRWSAVFFNKENYEVWQEGSLFAPFPSRMQANTVVFDFPYFDLSRAGQVRGVVGWGAHDPGIELSATPKDLLDELLEKHGAYPANQWIYGFAWPSAERCQTMGNALAEGVALRSKIALWLLKERFDDWDLALIHVSEAHSVLEALWHGVDEWHPLHNHPSSWAAAEGVNKVYRAMDRLVGTLTAEFEDATILLFSMHGMGPNRSDVPGMVLLPELLHRHAFGRSFFSLPESWTLAADGVPILGEDEDWHVVTPDTRSIPKRTWNRLVRRNAAKILPEGAKAVLKHLLRVRNGKSFSERQAPGGELLNWRKASLEWMPAARYQPLWPKMPAFAFPAFYDGRIRINLRGRERMGIVPLERYEACCEEIMRILVDCRDPFSGERVVDDIEWPGRPNPLDLAASRADLNVNWKGNPLCLDHPGLGRVGPVPFRRTGGHTGLYGMAYLKSDSLSPGDYGTRSSFDVVPTLFDLLNEHLPEQISGQSLVDSRGSGRRDDE